ncbi:hypothetical protein C491_04050 [Natronococcus amylolyticus DSM 10524]|uniref:DUF2795 domain-containing protein n=1 Tax=Natronococcus amylolyticus DSM 10524 TaxID=1227497 RepID=L9XIE0_9EURY|nr:hypothetical protein [Natronococcus amylolyticus]ELY60438.1 hypothetical protein C491_04050 [Natronococcus amylolyticus DSM 10524]
MEEVKLSRIDDAFERLEYPIEAETAATELEGVTLLLADGERNLGELVGRTNSDRFESADDLETELHNVLPREAVGEPYQSEGEG